jgi:DNA-binding transcriptional ArsR family regulator
MVVDSLSLTLGALADPTRRSILGRLVEGPATVGELARPFRMSQQAVSKHLARLERASLVEKRRDGRIHICSLDARPLREVAAWTAEYRRFWEDSFARLDAVLEELKAKEASRERKD